MVLFSFFVYSLAFAAVHLAVVVEIPLVAETDVAYFVMSFANDWEKMTKQQLTSRGVEEDV